MVDIVTRAGKWSKITWNEMDSNLENLKDGVEILQEGVTNSGLAGSSIYMADRTGVLDSTGAFSSAEGGGSREHRSCEWKI